MYADIVPNLASPPAVLLRQSRREGGKIVKTTLANLSQCPPEAVAALRLALRGVALVPHEEVFAVERSLPHGHVQAVLGVMRTLGMDTLLAARPCRERDLVLAMIAQRLLDPCSKLATTRVWHTTTLAQELGVDDADANDLYAALDWLISASAVSRRSWRRVTSPTARGCFSMSRVRPVMAGRAPSPDGATTATGRSYRALSTAC